tara:strand:+ start:4065 stop:4622 length:558 start_codon:yes stop_codon:yes gene_type:complete
MTPFEEKEYEAGFRDGERSEQELREAASKLLALQNMGRKRQNKNLRNQVRSLLGEWLELFSKSRWKEKKQITVQKMAHDIAANWENIISLLITELQRQMRVSNQELQDELNKDCSTEENRITLANPLMFDLLSKKLKEIAKHPYQTDSIKKHIRRSKPPHLVAGRPRKIDKFERETQCSKENLKY